MLTELERSRLEKRDNKNPTEEEKRERRYNDMIVRNKIKLWMEDTKDVLSAINKLPKKQVCTIATDDQIFGLLSTAMAFINALDFYRVEGENIEDAVAVKTQKNDKDQWEKWARKAEEKDFERNAALFWVISALASHTSYNDLDKNPALTEYILNKADEQCPIVDGKKEPLFEVIPDDRYMKNRSFKEPK